MTYPAHDPALPVVLIDFDGTLATNTWPSPVLGLPNEDAIRMLLHYAELSCEIHVFTARPESHWPRIWGWLRGQQIEHLVYEVSNIKRPASLLFDDRCYRWPL